jgi:hypothetical protein
MRTKDVTSAVPPQFTTHVALSATDHHRGFAVTGSPASLYSTHDRGFFDEAHRTTFGCCSCGGSQPAATPSLSVRGSLLLPVINACCYLIELIIARFAGLGQSYGGAITPTHHVFLLLHLPLQQGRPCQPGGLGIPSGKCSPRPAYFPR